MWTNHDINQTLIYIMVFLCDALILMSKDDKHFQTSECVEQSNFAIYQCDEKSNFAMSQCDEHK